MKIGCPIAVEELGKSSCCHSTEWIRVMSRVKLWLHWLKKTQRRKNR